MAYFDGVNAPTISLEMQLVTTWTAVSVTDVKTISVRRGRTRENQNVQPGTLTVTLDNTSGEYNPDNQSSIYFVGGRTYLDAKTAIRLVATWNSVDYIIYNGFIEDVQVDVSLAPVTTITATDALAFFGRTKLALPALPGTQTVHNRINTILGNFNVNWTATDIGTGNRNIVVQDETQDVLSLLEEAANCEFGRFWIDREGTAYFRSWNELPTMPFAFDLTDLHDLDTIEYDVISTEPGSKYRINSVSITGNNSSTASGSDSDSTSISYYGLFAQEYSLPLANNTDCNNLAAEIVGRFALPATRVNHIEFEAVGMGDLWESILPADLNNLVNVDRTTVDGMVMEVGGFIEGFNFDISPESWRYSLDLSDFAYTYKHWLAQSYSGTDLQFVKVTSKGDVYFVGNFWVFFVDKNGNLLWQKQLSNFVPSGSIEIDSNDNLYLAGQVSGGLANGSILKINTDGNIVWNKVLANNAGFFGIAISSTDVYVATSNAMVSYTLAGNLNWQKSYSNSYPYRIKYYNNAIYGIFENNIITKFNTSGNIIWNYVLTNTPGVVGYQIKTIDVNPYTDDIWLTASVVNGGSNNLSIFKIDDSGSSPNITYQQMFSTNTNSITIGSPFAFDSSSVYILGKSGSGDTFLLNLDNSNLLIWQNSISGFSDKGALATNSPNYIYFGSQLIGKLPSDGSKTGTYTIGSTSVTYAPTSYTLSNTSITLTSQSATASTTSYTSSNGSASLSTSSLNYTKVFI